MFFSATLQDLQCKTTEHTTYGFCRMYSIDGPYRQKYVEAHLLVYWHIE